MVLASMLTQPRTSDQASLKRPAVADSPEIVIQPRRPWSLGLRSLWSHRELTYYLIWRDIKLRYKQTFFGAGWALIQPIMLMGVFGLFFGRFAGLALGWPAVLDLRARRTCSVDVLFECPGSLFAERRHLESGRLEGVLPPAHHSGRCGGRVPRRSCARFCVSGCCEPFWASIRPGASCSFPVGGLALLTVSLPGCLACRAERPLSRHHLHGPVPDPGADVCFADRLSVAPLIPPDLRALYGLNPLAGADRGFSLGIGRLDDPSVVGGRGFVRGDVRVAHSSDSSTFARSESSFADVI